DWYPYRHVWPRHPGEHRAMLSRERLDRERLDRIERHGLVMFEDGAARAFAIGLERPGCIDGNDASAESRSDQGMKIFDAAAGCCLCAALCALLNDLGFTDSAAEDTRC